MPNWLHLNVSKVVRVDAILGGCKTNAYVLSDECRVVCLMCLTLPLFDCIEHDFRLLENSARAGAGAHQSYKTLS